MNCLCSDKDTLLVRKITDAFQNKEDMLGVYLDFLKSFDTINHKILLKARFHG